MALIEFNNYYNDAKPITFWHEFQPYLNILIGSAITFLSSMLIRYWERKSIANSYKYQLKALKKPIINQTRELQNCVSLFKQGLITRVPLFGPAKFLEITKLDRVKIINHLKWKKTNKKTELEDTEAELTERISSVLYSFESLAEISKTMFTDSEIFRNERKKMIQSYRIQLDIFRRTLSKHYDENKSSALGLDPMFKPLIEILQEYFPENQLDFDLIMKGYKEMHRKLLIDKSFTNSNSSLYPSLINFVQNASDIVGTYKAEERDFYTKIEDTISLYKSAFKNIYNEEMMLN